MRTLGGWIPVSDFTRSNGVVRFNIDESTKVSPSDLDRQIVEEALKIFSSEAVWDRADDRRCSPDDRTWSIYCAMERASIIATGGIHHRRPAMQVVRELVDERSAGRRYSHRLMDHNNDPTTTLADIRSLFEQAIVRLK